MGWEERRTLILVCLAGIMERADEALLPAVYKEVGAAIGATPAGLGSLTLFRSMVQTACYPLAAFAALRYNRCHVIAAGAFLWAAATFLVAVSSSFPQVALSRAFNGVGLALVTPAIQSLIADSTDDRNRGTAFGWLSLTSGLGSIFGGFFSIILASSSFMGIDGWRIAFHLVAIVSVIVGVLVFLYAVDPHFAIGASNGSISEKSITDELKEMVKQAKQVMKITSFQIIVAQGISGSFPWSAMSFLAMWLELIGFSHETTGVLMAMFSVATSIGGFFGGRMGDFLADHFPNAGRILLSQISSGSAIPFAAVLLLALPDDPSTGLAHGLVLFFMGLSISWNGPATNNPIFAEIVPERSRTSIYALDRSFESLLASFAPPVVGVLAQHMYSYKPVPRGASEATSTEVDRENAASLAKALYTAIAIPMFVCCFIYSFLYCTYPRDRERARMDSLIESEMKNMDSENGCCTSDEYQAQLFEACDGRTATDMGYGENFEAGDGDGDEDEDENALLSHQVDSKN